MKEKIGSLLKERNFKIGLIVFCILLLLVFLVPIKKSVSSNVTEYKALFYRIVKVQKSNYDETNGTYVELFGRLTFNNIEIEPTENEIKMEDVKNNEDVIFTITRGDKKCNPMKLVIYDNNKYDLYTGYEACKPFSTCTMMLKYTEKKTGTYDYDVLSILKQSREVTDEDVSYPPMYEIYTGKDRKKYVAGINNEILEEFLNSIDVDLNECAKAEYK